MSSFGIPFAPGGLSPRHYPYTQTLVYLPVHSLPSHAVIALTAIYRKVPEGYIGFVEELPGANTQAATLPEARVNLREAVELVLQASREMTERELGGAEVIRETLEVSA